MPPRSKVHQLESDAKAWLDRELIKRNFSGYEELEALLAERGFHIGKSSIQRYGAELEAQQMAIKAATDGAKAIAAEVDDSEGAMGQALVAMCQKHLFDLFINADDEEPLSPKALSQLTNAISRISRANIAQKKYAQEVKQRAKAAAEKAANIASKGGLSADSVQMIRKEILGIPDG